MDVYKIAVEISLSGNLAQALTGIGGQMVGLEGKVNKIKSAFGGWGTTLMAVGGILAAGLIVKGIEDIFESTKKLSHELAQIQKMGATPIEMGRLHAASIDIIRKTPGLTESDLANLYGQTRAIFRGPEEAMAALPSMAKFTQLLGNNTGDYEGANKSMMSMIRSADLIGRLSDAQGNLDIGRLQRFLDIAARVSIGTHGAIGPAEWLAMAKQGGPSLRALTDEGLTTAGIVAQAMGAARYGTASMSLMQQFGGGTMFTRNAESLQQHGLLKPGEWTKDHGRVILTEEGSKRMMDMIKDDPLAFVERLMKNYAARGITSKDDQIRSIFRDFGRQTTQREIADILMNFNQMKAEREQIEKALGVGGAVDLQNATDITAAMHNLGASFEELKQAIGGPENNIIVLGINKITGAINGLTEIVRLFQGVDFSKFKQAYDSMSWLRYLLPGGPVMMLLDALGWAGKHASDLNNAASAIGNVINTIASIPGRLGKWFGWLFGPSAAPAEPAIPRGGGPYAGAPVHGSLWHQSYVPPAADKRPIVTTATLNIDGQQLAQTLTSKITEDAENSPISPSSNGASYFDINGGYTGQ